MKALLHTPRKVPEASNEPVSSDREALRALVDEADVLGVDPDGCSWVLIRTTPDLIAYLESLDAEVEDFEGEAADDEPDDEDTCVEDQALDRDVRAITTDLAFDCDAEPDCDDEDDYRRTRTGPLRGAQTLLIHGLPTRRRP